MELEKPSQQGCCEREQCWMVQRWVVYYSVAHCSLVAETVVPRKAHQMKQEPDWRALKLHWGKERVKEGEYHLVEVVEEEAEEKMKLPR
jgi:hypothetical protein